MLTDEKRTQRGQGRFGYGVLPQAAMVLRLRRKGGIADIDAGPLVRAAGVPSVSWRHAPYSS